MVFFPWEDSNDGWIPVAPGTCLSGARAARAAMPMTVAGKHPKPPKNVGLTTI